MLGGGSNLGKLYASLSLRHDDLLQSIGYSKREIRQFSQFTAREVALINQALSSIGKTMSLAVTAPLALATGAGLKFAASIETQRKAYQVLLGDMEKGAALFEKLVDFSAQTPLQLPDITKTAQALLSYGTRAEEIIDKLRMLGDAAMGNAGKLESLSRAYGRVQAKGKASLEELNIILEAGIPIIQEMSEQLGVTQAELYDMVSSGAVGFAEVDAALQSLTSGTGKFAGMMEQIAQTTEGKLSTALDNLRIAGADAVESLLPLARDVLDGVTNAAQAFTELDDTTKKTILTLGAVLALTGPLASFAGSIGKLSTVVKGLSLFLASNPIALIATGAAVAIPVLVNVAGKVAAVREEHEKLSAGYAITSGELDRLVTKYRELDTAAYESQDAYDEQQRIFREIKEILPGVTEEVLKNKEAFEEHAAAVGTDALALMENQLSKYRADVERLNAATDEGIATLRRAIANRLRQYQGMTPVKAADLVDKAGIDELKVLFESMEAQMRKMGDPMADWNKLLQESGATSSVVADALAFTQSRMTDLEARIATLRKELGLLSETPTTPPPDEQSKKSWRAYWAEFLALKENAYTRIEELDRRAKASGDASYDAVGEKIKFLREQFQGLLDIPASDIDEVFTLNDRNTIQVLTGWIKELEALRETIEDVNETPVEVKIEAPGPEREVFEQLIGQLDVIRMKEAMLGDAFDENAEKANAFEAAILELVRRGLSPESDALQFLIPRWEELAGEIKEAKDAQAAFEKAAESAAKLTGFMVSISDAVKSGIENGMSEADISAITGELDASMKAMFTDAGGPIGEAFWNIGKMLRDAWHSLDIAIFGSVEPSQEFLDSLDAIGKESGSEMVDRMMEEYRTSLPDQLIEASQSMVGSIVQGFRSGDWDSLGTIIEDNIRSMVIDKVLTMGAFADQMEAAVQSLFQNVTKSGAELQSEKKGEIEYAREQQKAYLDAYNAYVGLNNKIKDNQNQIDAMSGWDKFWSREDDKLQQEIDAMKLKQAEFTAGYNEYITWEEKIIELKKELAEINPELAGSLSLEDITPEKIQELVDEFGDKIRPILEALGLETGKDFGDYFIGTLDGALAEAAWNGDFDSFKTAFGNQLKQALITEALEASAYQQQIDAIVAAITTAGENGFTETEIDDLLGMYRGVFDTISDAVGEYADIFNRLGISGGELDVKVESRGTVISKMTGDDRNYLSDAIREIGTTLQDAIANSPLMQLQTADIAQMTIQQMIVNNLNFHVTTQYIYTHEGEDIRTLLGEMVREALN